MNLKDYFVKMLKVDKENVRDRNRKQLQIQNQENGKLNEGHEDTISDILYRYVRAMMKDVSRTSKRNEIRIKQYGTGLDYDIFVLDEDGREQTRFEVRVKEIMM